MATTNDKPTTMARTPNFLSGAFRFIQEVGVELRKTTWPTPKEAWRLTVVVLTVIIIVGVYVGLIDFFLTKLTVGLKLFK